MLVRLVPNSQPQVICLLRPPKVLGLQAWATVPSLFSLFKRAVIGTMRMVENMGFGNMGWWNVCQLLAGFTLDVSACRWASCRTALTECAAWGICPLGWAVPFIGPEREEARKEEWAKHFQHSWKLIWKYKAVYISKAKKDTCRLLLTKKKK